MSTATKNSPSTKLGTDENEVVLNWFVLKMHFQSDTIVCSLNRKITVFSYPDSPVFSF